MAAVFTTKSAENQTNDFRALIDLWQSQRYASEITCPTFPNYLTDNPAWQQLVHAGPCLTWVLDVRTAKYIFVSQNCKRLTGLASESLLKVGINQMQSLLHPEDAAAYWKLMRRVWKFLLALPPQQRRYYQFSCDYRIRKANGSAVRVLEQNTVLQTDKHHNITHVLGTCQDITPWKTTEQLVASVYSPETDVSFECTSTDDTAPTSREPLSKREKEILKLVAEGYSSKYIADYLCISFHTVNTHRHKMIGKTNTKNTGELVQYAYNNKLI